MSKTRIVIKRLAAGLIDFIFAASISSILNFFNVKSGSGPILVIYIITIYRYQSTLGGLLLNLKISSLGNRQIKGGLSFLRAILLYAFLEIISLCLIGNSTALGLMALIILLSTLSIMWSEKGLMLHDFIARSFVEEDKEKKYAKEKKQILIMLAILVIAKIFVTYKDNQNNNHCLNLVAQQKFQEVIDQCKDKRDTDPSAHLAVSVAYMGLQKYNEAIVEANMASFLGEKEIPPYIIAPSYLALNKPDAVLQISEKQIDDSFMLLMSAGSYMTKYSQSSNPNDLIKASAYLKLITPEVLNKKYHNKMVQKMVDNFLNSGAYDRTKSAIELQVQKNLSKDQQLEIEKTALRIKGK